MRQASSLARARLARKAQRIAVYAVSAALLTLLLAPGLAPTPAANAFGTVNGPLGQRAEHERITRIALGCAPGAPSDGSCFEPVSLDNLAGKEGTFGAVGAPDSDQQILDPRAHCDNADFLAVDGYPQSKEDAAAALQACIDHLRDAFNNGVEVAGPIIDEDGTVSLVNTELITDCTFTLGLPGRAKCNVIQEFGRALHGAQDFYAHSNWADEADPNRPISIENPPGLNLQAPSPLLDMRATGPVTAPDGFATGFGDFKGAVLGGDDACPGDSGRITHACLNKDLEEIQPGPGVVVNGQTVSGLGSVSDPQTPRGKVKENALKAVGGAILESRRQWQDFRAALIAKYGQQRGTMMILVLTKDGALTAPEGLPEIPNAPGGGNLPNLPNLPNIPGLPRP
jgi:hypothetical protein